MDALPQQPGNRPKTQALKAGDPTDLAEVGNPGYAFSIPYVR